MIKNRNALPERINIFVIQKILEECRTAIKFTDISRVANIRYKKGLLKYLKFCVNHNLIQHRKVKERNQSIYEITDNGRVFLTLLNNPQVRTCVIEEVVI